MKDQIVHKATELFLNFGFKSVTMDDIARELGISKKTIYVYFNNKSKLIKSVSDQLFCSIMEGINLIRSQQNHPIEELFNIKDFVNEHLNDEKSSPVFQLQKYYPKLFDELMKKQRDIVNQSICENLLNGISKGLYRSSIDIEFTWRIYFAGINVIKNDDLFPLNEFPKKDINDMYLEYHLRALVTDKGLDKLNELLKH